VGAHVEFKIGFLGQVWFATAYSSGLTDERCARYPRVIDQSAVDVSAIDVELFVVRPLSSLRGVVTWGVSSFHDRPPVKMAARDRGYHSSSIPSPKRSKIIAESI
jgi:hypothetical protein